jgi:hypothetical protein
MRPVLRRDNTLAIVLAALILGGCGPATIAAPHAPLAAADPPPVALTPLRAAPERPSPPQAQLQGLPVRVTVSGGPAGRAVPPGFIGLSFETSELPRVASFATRGDMVALLRSLPGGVMRFGGVTTDRDGGAPVSVADLRTLAQLARETGWRVLLTADLGRFDPAAAAAEVRAAHQALGAQLAAVELGNEPDRFVVERLRPRRWTFADYVHETAEYRRAIAGAAPGVPLIGPGVSTGIGPLPWVGRFGDALRPSLLSDHYYPQTACNGNRPKIADLLSSATRTQESAMLRRLAAISSAAATPLRIDETNDISCHGQPGVSNTFAAALWAVDYGLRAIGAGVRGLNFHDLIAEPRSYAPLAATTGRRLHAGRLRANAEWYALLLLGRLQGSRPLRTAVSSHRVEAAAFRAPDGKLQLLLIDLEPAGAPRLQITLRLPDAVRGGTILRLHAPSLSATTGITLGGAHVSGSGAWSAPAQLPQVASAHPQLALTPGSAALVTLSG